MGAKRTLVQSNRIVQDYELALTHAFQYASGEKGLLLSISYLWIIS